MTQPSQEQFIRERQERSQTRHETLLTLKNFRSEDQPVPNNKFAFDTSHVLEDSKFLMKSAFVTSLTYLCNIMQAVICFRYVGQYGNEAELAGASIGYTWANVVCLGILLSIDQGFSVLAARLFGAEKHRELGVLYQRNILVLTIVAIPLLLTFFFADNMLIALGLDAEVSINAGLFLKSLFPSVVGISLFNTTRYFLITQNIFNIQCILSIIAVGVHLLGCHIFVVELGMPLVGTGLSKSIAEFAASIALVLYIQYSKICKESWIPFTKECIEGWWSHLKHTLVLGGNMYVEWISFEISMVIISLMNNAKILGAHGIAVNFVVGLYSIPLGTNISMQIFMGNAVGEGSKVKAQRYMVAGIFLNFLLSGATSLALVLFSDQIAGIFVNDEETLEILSTMLFIFGFGYVFDTFANHVGGVLRIMGKEHEVVKDFVYCYFVAAGIFQYTFGIVLGYGYPAVWIGTTFGVGLMLVLMFRKMSKLNWDEEIEKLKEVEDKETSSEYIEFVEKKSSN